MLLCLDCAPTELNCHTRSRRHSASATCPALPKVRWHCVPLLLCWALIVLRLFSIPLTRGRNSTRVGHLIRPVRQPQKVDRLELRKTTAALDVIPALMRTESRIGANQHSKPAGRSEPVFFNSSIKRWFSICALYRLVYMSGLPRWSSPSGLCRGKAASGSRLQKGRTRQSTHRHSTCLIVLHHAR